MFFLKKHGKEWENQHYNGPQSSYEWKTNKILISMGYLHGVTVDIEGESTIADFEVIERVDENNPYPMLLGIDWAFDMNAIINREKRNMTF